MNRAELNETKQANGCQVYFLNLWTLFNLSIKPWQRACNAVRGSWILLFYRHRQTRSFSQPNRSRYGKRVRGAVLTQACNVCVCRFAEELEGEPTWMQRIKLKVNKQTLIKETLKKYSKNAWLISSRFKLDQERPTRYQLDGRTSWRPFSPSSTWCLRSINKHRRSLNGTRTTSCSLKCSGSSSLLATACWLSLSLESE